MLQFDQIHTRVAQISKVDSYIFGVHAVADAHAVDSQNERRCAHLLGVEL